MLIGVSFPVWSTQLLLSFTWNQVRYYTPPLQIRYLSSPLPNTFSLTGRFWNLSINGSTNSRQKKKQFIFGCIDWVSHNLFKSHLGRSKAAVFFTMNCCCTIIIVVRCVRNLWLVQCVWFLRVSFWDCRPETEREVQQHDHWIVTKTRADAFDTFYPVWSLTNCI